MLLVVSKVFDSCLAAFFRRISWSFWTFLSFRWQCKCFSFEHQLHPAAAVMCYITTEDPWARPRGGHVHRSQAINAGWFLRAALFRNRQQILSFSTHRFQHGSSSQVDVKVFPGKLEPPVFAGLPTLEVESPWRGTHSSYLWASGGRTWRQTNRNLSNLTY